MTRFHLSKIISAGALALGLTAGAAAAQTEYRGGGFVSNFTQACATDGWTGTAQVIARMRPAGQPGNPANENTLNLFFDNFTYGMRFNQAAIGSSVTANSSVFVGGGFGLNALPQPIVRRLNPPAGTVLGGDAATHFVAEINNFGMISNCSARVNLWLHRR